MRVFFALIFTVIICCGCSSENLPDLISLNSYEEINGRDTDGPRKAIYRARIPSQWIRRDALPENSIKDTTLPLCEFLIAEEGHLIRIAIHNFAYDEKDQPRIPPMAQVARWQRQFDSLQANRSSTGAQSFNGYVGVIFTGVGMIAGNENMMLAWALQLPPEHYRNLSSDTPSHKQMRADVTIKAIGPQSMVEKHQADITAFARSFELIEEIPTRQ